MAHIQWFEKRAPFIAAVTALQGAMAERDAAIARSTSVPGHCPACDRPTVFQVSTSATFADRPNLREGLRCEHCRLTARQRLVALAMREEIPRMPSKPAGLLLEKTTLLYRFARAKWHWLIGSEFLGPQRISGRHYWWSTHWWRWRRTRHESITAFSLANQSVDLIAHSDVLEHVHDTALAALECVRVLRPGGVMLFTIPFFIDRDHSLLRGRPLADGSIEHLETPEYHGDGMSRRGIYTFHHFGWDFMDTLRAAGFSQVEIGLCHAPDEGLTSADPMGDSTWNIPPILFRAVR
ncbi:methyltransferase domain-containing protein [Rhodanobacter sp. L36]|uniref:class I SAM-dependent methyltransferase n=1 Tax=Rhodanobacter sp. L36 TaxID=1747221 RepID=UPI00131B3ED4|nr:methyltransferase domain-containing protein [Rhodanobacter sp. L36]